MTECEEGGKREKLLFSNFLSYESEKKIHKGEKWNVESYKKFTQTIYERESTGLLVVVSIYDVCEVSDDGGWIGIIAVKG